MRLADVGFVRAGSDCRVAGAPDVFVVGDAGPFPEKQGGIACQQADGGRGPHRRRVRRGHRPDIPFEPVLRGWLWDGDHGRFMRADLPCGRDESAGVSSREQPLWSPRRKVACRFLSAFPRDDPAAAPLADRIVSPEAPSR